MRALLSPFKQVPGPLPEHMLPDLHSVRTVCDRKCVDPFNADRYLEGGKLLGTSGAYCGFIQMRAGVKHDERKRPLCTFPRRANDLTAANAG